MLIDNLPADAAVWREDPPRWSPAFEPIAVLIEEIGRWHRYGLQIQGVKASKLPDPTDIRPAPPKKVLTDPNEIAAALHRIMPGGR